MPVDVNLFKSEQEDELQLLSMVQISESQASFVSFCKQSFTYPTKSRFSSTVSGQEFFCDKGLLGII